MENEEEKAIEGNLRVVESIIPCSGLTIPSGNCVHCRIKEEIRDAFRIGQEQARQDFAEEVRHDINQICLRHINIKHRESPCYKMKECASVIAVEIIDYFEALTKKERK